ncbi:MULTISPECIES: methyl-accepting chemotaxis protein [Vibrio]|uniref:methyl-accepting chemotaxis protein n=1 Tax=Vibrio TaxID=662 RepID=UPI00218A4DE9|nr:methyl-accepting chemotaxis protein [Vibrio mediterranei]USE02219.1 hypothetical protein JKJ11_15020 [Vibrio sp. SCSIO 43133]
MECRYETACAGEQGRSFVVAAEVRNIVCRTQQSIKEILEMMGNLQSGSQHAIRSINSYA